MKLKGISMDSYLFRNYFEKAEKEEAVVHSVFQSIINIKTRYGELFTLSSPREAYMPYMIKLKKEADFLKLPDLQGKRVRFDESSLIIEDKLEIDLKEIRLTDRQPEVMDKDSSQNPNAEDALKILLETGKRGGCLAYYGQYEGADLMERELQKRIKALEAYPDFGRLIGFGRGLTPSGDDFCLGFLCAAEYTEGKKIENMKEELKKSILMHRRGTTDVSRQMLMQALDRQYSGPLMDFCECIIRGESDAACRDSMLKLLNIGSTSGTDMATGVVFALEMAAK